jgi:release factor glutamine methyltransferase
VPEARLDAEYIIAHGLGMKRMELYLNFDRPLSENELATLRPLLSRRATREPLQHILEEIPWRNLNLKTDSRALIPRPETEEIIDLAKLYFKNAENKAIEVLDIGTGSGAIALAIAQEMPHSNVLAVDISLVALDLAIENSKLNSIQNIEFIQSDLFTNVDKNFDLIISNPPYIRSSVMLELDQEVKDFDPSNALDGGEDGLDFYRRICVQAHSYLNESGYLIFEISYDQSKDLKALENENLKYLETVKDLCKNDRFVVFQKL